MAEYEIEKYIGSSLNDIPQEVLDATPNDVFFSDYQESENGVLVKID